MEIVLFAGGGAVVLLLLAGVIVSIRGEKSLVKERLDQYFEEENVKTIQIDKRSLFGDWLDGIVAKSSFGDNISRSLARADLKLKAGEYVALILIATTGVGLVAWFLGGRSPISALLGAIIGSLLPRFYVSRQQKQRLIHFNEQLPDMLNLMVNGLRAGYSTMQAMEAVSRELPVPVSDEFRRVVQEMQIGIPMDKSLNNLLRRIPSEDLDLTIAAMNVQREVGGNLAEILDTISYTIRERVRIKGEIRVLTSQVVYSGRFLSLMPVFIALALWFMNRPYMLMFVKPETRMIGIPVLIFGGFLILAGFVVMGKISAVDV
jgi:tight adherence protein B